MKTEIVLGILACVSGFFWTIGIGDPFGAALANRSML
jgi:hypothetical protein